MTSAASAEARVGRLPAQATRLIGRADEVAHVTGRLRQPEVRLLTLTGAAGAGKTRLAVAVAAELDREFAQGAWFIDLAPITDPQLVLPSVAQALGISEHAARSLRAAILEHIADQHLLVVLDNCEQVLGAAPLLAEVLRECAGLTVLATSRQSLRLSWEHEFPVGPLAPPVLGQALDLASIGTSPAVALFVQRAQALRPEFRLTDENAAAVAELCVRLDGLPLALELAAARIKVLPPYAILQRLEERLTLLGGGPADWPARHRTLRTAIDWSYALLPDDERALFRRLSVFAAGGTLEAVASVCGDSVADADLLQRIGSLVDKSLLRVTDTPAGEPRFTMLETIRAYALEQLGQAGDLEAVRRRHAEYMLELAETAQSEWWGANQARWLDRLEREHHNVRAALRWAAERGDETAELELRLVGALWRFWAERGHLAEGRGWLERALSRRRTGADLLRAAALNGAGNLARAAGDYQAAQASYAEAAALYRANGDERALARVLSNLGNVAYDQGTLTTARERFEESRALRERLGDRRGVAMILTKLGNVARGLGDLASARSLHEAHLALARDLDDRWGIAQALDDLGIVALEEGDPIGARPLHEESLSRFRELGDVWGSAHALYSLGRVARAVGELEAAERFFVESLTAFRNLGDVYDVSVLLGALGTTALARAEGERAAVLLEAAARLRANAGCALPPLDQTAFDDALRRARTALSQKAFSGAVAQARSITLDQALGYALARPSPAPPPGPTSTLTRREREVAVLVARGLSNLQIAEQLIIGERTVESHVSNLLRKLDLPSRTRLASWATQHGLV